MNKLNVRDPHRFSHELDDELTQRIINRLESRARDEVFTRLFHQYADKLNFHESTLTLEVGCGTGAVARALARKAHFAGSIVGVDQSSPFIEAAQQFAVGEGVADKISFSVCDGHALDFDDESFDLAIAHTLISHVTDPVAIISELARVIRKQGSLVILDGDYASLTYAVPDHDFGRRMDHSLATASFNNPMVMRDLVTILPEMGFELKETMSDVVAEIGHASYFKSFAETYVPLVSSAGLMTDSDVERWWRMVNQKIEERTFFASCNYYTYIAQLVD